MTRATLLVPSFLLAIFTMTLTTSALASVKVKSSQEAPTEVSLSQIPLVDESAVYQSWFTDEEFKALKISALDRSKRTPASVVDPKAEPFKRFMRLRDRILKIETPEQIHALLTDLNDPEHWDADGKDDFDNSEMFLAAKLVPMMAFRGIAARIKLKSEIIHSTLVSAIKQMAVSSDILLPTSEWKAMFRYLTEPYHADMPLIKTESDFQAFVARELLPAVALATMRIEGGTFKFPSHSLNFKGVRFTNEAGIWDNQIFYGDASFKDGINRYVAIGEAERLARLSQLHFLMHSLNASLAFHWDGSMAAGERLIKLYGTDGLLASRVTGITARDRVEALNKSPWMGHKRTDGNDSTYMNRSWQHFQRGSQYLILVWNEMKNQAPERVAELLAGAQSQNAWAPRSTFFEHALPAFALKPTNEAIEELESMIKGRTKITSAITGESVIVDLPSLYKAEKLPKNLQAFLPIYSGKAPSDKAFKEVPDSKGKITKVEYRNYWADRPSQWDIQAYSVIFPGVTNATLPRARRILSQSYGASFIAPALALVTQ